MVVAAHVTVLLTARHAVRVFVAVALGLAVVGTFRAAQPPGALLFYLRALLGTGRGAGLGAAGFRAGLAHAFAVGLQRRYARGIDRGGFAVRFAVFIANELAMSVTGKEDTAAGLEPGFRGGREPCQHDETTQHT